MAGGSSEGSAAIDSRSNEGNTSKNITTIKTLNMLGSLMGSYSMVKLNHDTFLLWKNMVLPLIRGNKLKAYITGAKICQPEFTEVAVVD